MKRITLLAGGMALATLGAVLTGGEPARAQLSDPAAAGPAAALRPPLARPDDRLPIERLVEGVMAEADHSGRRLARILRGTRDGVADLLRSVPDALPREVPSARQPAATMPEEAAPSAGGRRVVPDDDRLDELQAQLEAYNSPRILAPSARPLREAAAAPGQREGSAAGARRLLDRLEARGDMAPRWEEEVTPFSAMLSPAALEVRFGDWAPETSPAQAASGATPDASTNCLEGSGSSGNPLHLMAQAEGDGLTAPGRYESGATHLAALISDEPRRLPDGSVFMPKLTQRLLGIRTVVSCAEATPRVEQLIGRVIGNPNASGLVQAGQTGRIRPGPQGLPELGMEVREGQPLAVLVPNLTTVERGQLESRLAELRNQIIGIELQLARTRDFPIVPFRTGRLLSLRLELDGLRKQRDSLIGGIDNQELLLSPMNGVVATTAAVSGQLVQAGETLWQILDPARMRVEAIAFDEPMTRSVRGAWAVTSDGEAIELSFVGRGLTLMNQGVPLHFEIRGQAQGLSVGTPLSVYVDAGAGERAVVLPKGALVRDEAGRTVVWEYLGGERFVSRAVHAEPLNGQQVLVRDGLPEDIRVVHLGASHISQVR